MMMVVMMMKTITLIIRFVNLHIALALLGLNAVPARSECVDDGVACDWVFGVGAVAELKTRERHESYRSKQRYH